MFDFFPLFCPFILRAVSRQQLRSHISPAYWFVVHPEAPSCPLRRLQAASIERMYTVRLWTWGRENRTEAEVKKACVPRAPGSCSEEGCTPPFSAAKARKGRGIASVSLLHYKETVNLF